MCRPKWIAFIGPAGVGKTYNLVEAVRDEVQTHPCKEFQTVLGLTFMHGARRRLHKRLALGLRSQARVECSTIDSFALGLVRRFRRHLGFHGLIFPDDSEDEWVERDRQHYGSFAIIRQAASHLIGIPEIRSSLSQAYPILVVDEFQDCRDGLLVLVQALARSCNCFFAADEFQSLDDNPGGGVAWLESAAEVRRLEIQRRTQDSSLLSTAKALRSNVATPHGVDVISPDGPGLAAWEVATRIVGGGVKVVENRRFEIP